MAQYDRRVLVLLENNSCEKYGKGSYGSVLCTIGQVSTLLKCSSTETTKLEK